MDRGAGLVTDRRDRDPRRPRTAPRSRGGDGAVPTPTGCARRIRSPARRSPASTTTSSSTARASNSTSTAAPTARSTRRPSKAGASRCGTAQPERALVDRSLAIHAAYYRMLGHYLDDIAAEHGRFVAARRPQLQPSPRRARRRRRPTQDKAPDINIGTFSMPREQWAFLLDPLIEAMRDFDFNGRRLDVRENIAFQGKGEQTRFVHDRYPGTRLRDRDRVQEILHGRMDRRARPGRARRDAPVHHDERRHRARLAGMSAARPHAADARVRRAWRAAPAGRRERPGPSRPLAAVPRRSIAATADGGSLARRVAINSPAYLVWSPDDDDVALRHCSTELIAAIEQRARRRAAAVHRCPTSRRRW